MSKELSCLPGGLSLWKCWDKKDPTKVRWVHAETAYYAWNAAATDMGVDPDRVGCKWHSQVKS